MSSAMHRGATGLVTGAWQNRLQAHRAGADLQRIRILWDVFQTISGSKQRKVNIFFARPGAAETTHFCGLQSLNIPRDSC